MPFNGRRATETDRLVRARAGIAAVGALLEILEQPHLPPQVVGVAMLRECQRGLEVSGLSVPVAVSSATTTTVLRERVRAWHEELLDAAYPRRAHAASAGLSTFT